MEELIGRYFFIVVIIFATVLDLVGRWYKNRQRRDGRARRPPQRESRQQVAPVERVDWQRRKKREPEPSAPRDFAQIILSELAPPESWTEIRRPTPSGLSVEQPLIARVVPARRDAAGRDPAQTARPAPGRVAALAALPESSRAVAQPTSAATFPRVQRRLRTAIADPIAARRAVLLAEVLGPCRALEPYGQRR